MSLRQNNSDSPRNQLARFIKDNCHNLTKILYNRGVFFQHACLFADFLDVFIAVF